VPSKADDVVDLSDPVYSKADRSDPSGNTALHSHNSSICY